MMTPRQRVIAAMCRAELGNESGRYWCLSSILENAGLSPDLSDPDSQRAASAAIDVVLAYRVMMRPNPCAADEFAEACARPLKLARDTVETVALRVLK